MTAILTTDILRKVAPRISGERAQKQSAIIDKTVRSMPMVRRVAAINTDLRMAHFLAQLAHESDGFCTLEEYASGSAYEGRKDLGNIRAGDGKRYKGRGLIQVTGRTNYAVFTKWLEVNKGVIPCNAPPNFEYAPHLLADFPFAVMCCGWYWQTRSLNILADKDDLAGITKKVNGGLNGLDSRRAYLAKAKAALRLNGTLAA